MEYTTSLFTEYLFQLAHFSEKADNCELDNNIDFQRFESKIINAYKAGYFGNTAYKALMKAYYTIKAGNAI